jgi:hypothetical protein
MSTIQMKTTPDAQLQAQSGTQYTADVNGYAQVAAGDVRSAIDAGWTVTSGSSSGSGIFPNQVRFSELKNTDGSALAAAASSGKLGNSITLGTSQSLVGEAAESNTKTDSAIFEYVLPGSYNEGSNINVTVNANYSGTGTAGTKTIAALAYLNANAGTQGSNLIATSAATDTATAADYVFVITGTGLAPGNKLTIELTAVMQETGGSASLTQQINSIRIG